ncbi:MAG: alpha/beta hydrolase fold domain-containing protein, partial [Opitutaceae bacterium]|nr:alpha/beta hydrolase fold domain-containing protein [Opitutaceae bacterium]
RLPAAHRDVSRAVQFLRQRAAEWRLDTSRFGGFGGSAGAQLVMYLAFHDDLADPRSADPVARESSRLACAAPQGGQASMGLEWWDAHIPHNTTRASRLPSLAAWNEKWFGTSDPVSAAAIVAETSALTLLTRDDPPVFLTYGMPPDSPRPADPQAAENWISHHVAHGVALKKRCDELGVEAHLKYPGARPRYTSGIEFLKARLLAP